MNAKQKDALKKLSGAFEVFVTSLCDEEDTKPMLSNGDNTPIEEPDADQSGKDIVRKINEEKKPPVNPVKQVSVPPVKKPTASVEEEKGVNGYTKNELIAMGYNAMKSLAKELGFKATGDRDAILTMLMTETPPKTEDKPEEKKSEVKKNIAPPIRTPKGKTVTPEPEDEDEEDDTDEDDGVEAKVEEATKDMSDEELLDFLTENKIKAKGKRQALLAATAKAVREGLIDLEDEEDPDEDDDTAVNDEEGDEDEFDPKKINDLNNPDMTEARAAAIQAMVSDLKEQFKNKELTRKDMVDFINEYYSDNGNTHKGESDKELLEMYTDLVCLFLNDEGEMPDDKKDPSVYSVNDKGFCCGHPCKWDDDNSCYVCEVCGAELVIE